MALVGWGCAFGGVICFAVAIDVCISYVYIYVFIFNNIYFLLLLCVFYIFVSFYFFPRPNNSHFFIYCTSMFLLGLF